ncbi:MAG: type II secretion system protein [Planctomycetes bacterium]|nr:type II secretion system protein [Planctomycetota bacterium]
MRSERGLTLIEICVATAMLATVAMGVAASMMSGLSSNRVYRENTLVLARAQHHVETMYNLQFGTSADATATQAQLDVVFSGDPELGLNPPSLHAICKAIDARPEGFYEFAPPNLGFPGTLLAYATNNVLPTLSYPVSVDANGDGVPDAGVASMIQGQLVSQFGGGAFEADAGDAGRELFAFEIYFRPAAPPNAAPRLVLRCFRAQDY